MALTNAFYEAVKSGNVRRVRIMMKDSLLWDTTFAEFDAMEEAASSMSGLYDAHDGKELLANRNLWSDDYMNKLMVEILSNFSHERMAHLKEVVRYLRPVAPITSPKREYAGHEKTGVMRKGSYEEEKRRCQEQGDYLGAKIGVVAVAGAAIGSVIMAATGASVGGVVLGASVGAIAGGASMAFAARRKDDE